MRVALLLFMACAAEEDAPADLAHSIDLAVAIDLLPDLVPPDPAMVYIGGATVRVGAPDSYYNPERTVTVDGFWLDRLEVTEEAFLACLDDPFCGVTRLIDFQAGDPMLPMHKVSVADARAFCAWRRARLPTIDEWARAAQGTDGRRHPWGAEPADCTRAQLAGCGDMPSRAPVGGRPDGANPEGVLDLVGNVAEWVEYPGTYLPAMGGSYYTLPADASATAAVSDEDGVFIGLPDVGFRCAHD